MNGRTKYIAQFLFVVALATAMFFVAREIAGNEAIQNIVERFGYGGIFVIAVLSGFNVAFPIPAVTFLPVFLAADLNVWLVIGVLTLGMTCGDSIGYLLGKSGRGVTPEEGVAEKVLAHLDAFYNKHPLWPYAALFFYISFAPAPNELVVVPMAFAGYQLRYMFPVIFFGNLIFNSLVAFGLVNALHIL